MTPPLIGLIGRKRSGKNTFARGIHRLGWQEVAFADPLREAALALDPIVDTINTDTSCGDPDCCGDGYPDMQPVRLSSLVHDLGWERAKEELPEVRRTLQRLGTDAVRALDSEFWLRIAAARIDARTAPVVVTDCRFPNEADAIRSRGGLIVRIVRPDLPPATDAHPSETALDDYRANVVVTNNRSADELGAEARRIADSLSSAYA